MQAVKPSNSFCLSHVGGRAFGAFGIRIRRMLKPCSVRFLLWDTVIASRGVKPSLSICCFLNHGLQ